MHRGDHGRRPDNRHRRLNYHRDAPPSKRAIPNPYSIRGPTERFFSFELPFCTFSQADSHLKFRVISATDCEYYLSGRWCDAKLVKALWTEKERLDRFFSSETPGGEAAYYKARTQVFPNTATGSHQGFKNRAADKLFELMGELHLWRFLESDCLVLDICSSPGAWSDMLLRAREQPRVLAMSLPIAGRRDQCFYDSLVRHPRFEPVWGPGEPGNVYVPENLQALRDLSLKRFPQGAHAVFADGGFGIRESEVGQRQDNFQETMSARIILSEFLAALMTLRDGGLFVCKIFDCFTDFTCVLLAGLAGCFERVTVVKTTQSRIVNSEKYVVCSGFLITHADPVLAFFTQLHTSAELWGGETMSLPALTELGGNAGHAVAHAIQRMNSILALRQVRALATVSDRTEAILQKR
eukprot:gnl/Chilomastix_cuspidata/1213.p1 GENE.gnl/Chilomastix_cuspidata/1213~~gnl/Chilomastix_cuspidata/1213.p1  ORF type:complete len:410 (-),score=22.42 gnl/Chilomastix_cuspidata/1213:23-1252(-)